MSHSLVGHVSNLSLLPIIVMRLIFYNFHPASLFAASLNHSCSENADTSFMKKQQQ